MFAASDGFTSIDLLKKIINFLAKSFCENKDIQLMVYMNMSPPHQQKFYTITTSERNYLYAKMPELLIIIVKIGVPLAQRIRKRLSQPVGCRYKVPLTVSSQEFWAIMIP